MARRIRTTVTVREDDPVAPRRRSPKKKNTILIVVILVILGLFLLSRGQRPGATLIQPASSRH